MSFNGGGGRSRGFGSGGGRRGGRGGGGGRGNDSRGYSGGGGHSGGSGSSGGSEICRRFTGGKCDYEQQNGRTCRYPHFIKKIGETRGHNGAIKDVVMWSARQQLFTCAADSTIKLWDCASWQEVTTISVLDQSNTSSSSSPDRSEGVSCMVLEGPFVFVGFDGKFPLSTKVSVGMIRGWNLETPQAPPFEFVVSENMPFAHTQNVLSLAVAMDPTGGGATLFSGSADGCIRYWQLDPSTNQFKCRGTLDGHVRGVTRLKTFVVGTARLLASSSIDTTIRLWDLATFQCIKVFTEADGGHVDAVMDIEVWVNGNDTFLFSGGLDKEVIVWGLTPPFQQFFKKTQDVQVTSLCGAQDNNQQPILFIGATDGSITVKELPSFSYKTILSGNANYGHRDVVRRISTGPLNTLFTVGNDRRMIAWQITGDVASIQS